MSTTIRVLFIDNEQRHLSDEYWTGILPRIGEGVWLEYKRQYHEYKIRDITWEDVNLKTKTVTIQVEQI